MSVVVLGVFLMRIGMDHCVFCGMGLDCDLLVVLLPLCVRAGPAQLCPEPDPHLQLASGVAVV